MSHAGSRRIFRPIASLDAFPPEFSSRPVHLGIGNFDGFHCGHRAIFRRAKSAAASSGGIVGALTFSPHPEVFFRGSGAVEQIFPRERKNELFSEAGLDFAVYEPFNAAFAAIEAEDFPSLLLKKIPSLRGIYIGGNFHFGAHRRGDAKLLKKLCAARGVAVGTVAPVNFDGARVSSTRIRLALTAGNVRAAGEMLGEPYRCCGNVIRGNRLGREIGFPTLNLEWNPECRPRFGVYVVRLSVPATGAVFRGVANYGVRPTVEKNAAFPLLETFLPDISSGTPLPTYDDFICVEWLDFLRPEMRFPGLDALKAQLARDRDACEAFPRERRTEFRGRTQRNSLS